MTKYEKARFQIVIDYFKAAIFGKQDESVRPTPYCVASYLVELQNLLEDLEKGTVKGTVACRVCGSKVIQMGKCTPCRTTHIDRNKTHLLGPPRPPRETK